MQTWKEAGAAELKLQRGRVPDRNCPLRVVWQLHVAEVVGPRAQRPGQDLCVPCHGCLGPQHVAELVQRLLRPAGGEGGGAALQVVVPVRNGHILHIMCRR